jgi:hypothetical protein
MRRGHPALAMVQSHFVLELEEPPGQAASHMGRLVAVGKLEESISQLWIACNLQNRLKCTPFIP